MFRHPRYLDIPWEIHWHPEGASHHHRWLMVLVIVTAGGAESHVQEP